MKSRPIIFDGESVRAILAGRKTQTRRVVKPQPTGEPRPLIEWSRGIAAACHDYSPDPAKLAAHAERLRGRVLPFTTESGSLGSRPCPYGAPGDELWVREAWAVEDASKLKLPEYCGGGNPDWIYYRDPVHIGTGLTWRSPIFMPRWASRLTLRVTDVRVERVQDVSEADAIAEGATRRESGWSCDWSRVGELSRYATASAVKSRDLAPLSGRDVALGTARHAFGNRWDAINAKRGFSWHSNPWVWVVSFVKLEELTDEK